MNLTIEYDQIAVESKNFLATIRDITREDDNVNFGYIILDKKNDREFTNRNSLPYIDNDVRNTQEKRDLIKIIGDVKFNLACICFLNTTRRFNDEKLINKAVNELKHEFSLIMNDINDRKEWKKKIKKIRNKA